MRAPLPDDLFKPKGPFPFVLADFEGGTVGWSEREKWRYFRLLNHLWQAGGVIEDDHAIAAEAMGINRAGRWLKGIFPGINKLRNHPEYSGYLYHPRLWRDIQRAKELSEKRADAANARWNAKASAPENQTQCTPSPSPSKKVEKDTENLPSSHKTSSHPAPNGASGKYVFEGITIRLIARDFNAWELTYYAIPDLRAELSGIDAWLQTQPPDKRKKWFHIVPGMLARKHQERLPSKTTPETKAPPEPPEPPRMYLHHSDGGMQEIYSPEPEHTPWKVFRTDPDGTVHYHNPSDRPPINTPDDDGE